MPPSTDTPQPEWAPALLGRWLTSNSSSILLHSIVGSGAFGAIFRGDEHNGCFPTGRRYAVKVLKTPPSKRDDSYKFIRREKNLHPAVRHPNVVSVKSVIDDPANRFVYIIMDFYQQGDLFKSIVDRLEFVGQDARVRDAFVQVAMGVRACHATGVFHRDIKPENVLVRETDSGYPRYALADFGLSTNEEFSSEFGVGSSYYMSLECADPTDPWGYRHPSYSCRANDIWSLGVLLINFACGRNPWVRAHPDEPTFAAFLRDPNYLPKILPISYELNNLLKRIFTVDPACRINIDDLIDAVQRIDRFTLSHEELCAGSETVRIAAGPLCRVREKQAMLNQVVYDDVPEFDHSSTPSPENFGDVLPDGRFVQAFGHGISYQYRDAGVAGALPVSYSLPPPPINYTTKPRAHSAPDLLADSYDLSPELSDEGSLPSTPGGPRTPGDYLALSSPGSTEKEYDFTSPVSNSSGQLALGLYHGVDQGLMLARDLEQRLNQENFRVWSTTFPEGAFASS